MLGLLGAVIFGIAATGAWISAEQTEQKSKSDAKQSGRKFYYDKNGIMRHPSGRKYTTQEVHDLFGFGQTEQIQEKYKRIKKDRFEKKYYAVLNPYKKFTQEVFLTYEEAKQYIEKCQKDNQKVKDEPWIICKEVFDGKKKYFKFVLHF